MRTKLFILLCFVFSTFISCTTNTETPSNNATPDTLLTQETNLTTNNPDNSAESTTEDSGVTDDFSKSFDITNYILKSLPDSNYTSISKIASIFISPDSLQIAKMQKEMGEDFSTIADDNSFYFYEAENFIEKKKITILHTNTRYLKFICKDKIIYFDTKAPVTDGWNLIFFRPDSLPKIIATSDVESEYKSYFGKE